MRVYQRFRAAVVALVATAALLTAVAPSAYAICRPARQIYCSDASVYYCAHDEFDGFRSGYSNVTTAQAVIAPYVPYVDFSHSGGVYAWPMIANVNCSWGYIQVGQMEGVAINGSTGGQDRVFTEVQNCNQKVDGGTVIYFGSGPNQTHKFTVNHSASYTLIVDNTTIRSGKVDWMGNDAQFFGETHQATDQMMGATNNRATFTGIQQCNYAGGYSCVNPLTTNTAGHLLRYSGEGYYAQEQYGANGSNLAIWDTACAN